MTGKAAEFEIINRGLAILGEAPIDNLQASDSRTVAYRSAWELTQSEILAKSQWGWAFNTTRLTPTTATSPFSEYPNVFDLPVDRYGEVEILDETFGDNIEGIGLSYKQADSKIYSTNDSIIVRYPMAVGWDKFPAYLDAPAVYFFAYIVSQQATGDNDRGDLYNNYERSIRRAITNNYNDTGGLKVHSNGLTFARSTQTGGVGFGYTGTGGRR